MFANRDDSEYALQQLASIHAGAINTVQVAPPVFYAPIANWAWEQDNERKPAHNVTEAFKKDDYFRERHEKAYNNFTITTKSLYRS